MVMIKVSPSVARHGDSKRSGKAREREKASGRETEKEKKEREKEEEEGSKGKGWRVAHQADNPSEGRGGEGRGKGERSARRLLTLIAATRFVPRLLRQPLSRHSPRRSSASPPRQGENSAPTIQDPIHPHHSPCLRITFCFSAETRPGSSTHTLTFLSLPLSPPPPPPFSPFVSPFCSPSRPYLSPVFTPFPQCGGGGQEWRRS